MQTPVDFAAPYDEHPEYVARGRGSPLGDNVLVNRPHEDNRLNMRRRDWRRLLASNLFVAVRRPADESATGSPR